MHPGPHSNEFRLKWQQLQNTDRTVYLYRMSGTSCAACKSCSEDAGSLPLTSIAPDVNTCNMQPAVCEVYRHKTRHVGQAF